MKEDNQSLLTNVDQRRTHTHTNIIDRHLIHLAITRYLKTQVAEIQQGVAIAIRKLTQQFIRTHSIMGLIHLINRGEEGHGDQTLLFKRDA